MPTDKVRRDHGKRFAVRPGPHRLWDKLGNVNESVARELFEERISADRRRSCFPRSSPSMAAPRPWRRCRREVRARSRPAHAAAWNRLQKDILDKIEQTLRVEFMSNLARHRQARRRPRNDGGNLQQFRPPDGETAFSLRSRRRSRDGRRNASKPSCSPFEDLGKLRPPVPSRTLLRHVEKDKLGAGAQRGHRFTARTSFFLQNMRRTRRKNPS